MHDFSHCLARLLLGLDSLVQIVLENALAWSWNHDVHKQALVVTT